MTVANELGFGLFTPMTLITLITLITLVTPNYPNYQDDHGNQNDFSLKHLIAPIALITWITKIKKETYSAIRPYLC